MESKSISRQRIGVYLFSGVCAAVLVSGISIASISHSRSAEARGVSDSASFTITYIVRPNLQSQMTVPNPDATEDGSEPEVIATDILTMDSPTDLCVAGTGLSNFSLTGDSPDGVELVLSGQDQDAVLGEEPTNSLAVAKNCDNSYQLMAQSQEGFQGSTEAALVVIQAE